jgi:DNA-binding CsgD family transcriptional regulator
MLEGDYLAVLEAKDERQFRAVVVRFAQRLGFETVSAMVAVDRVGDSTHFVAVHNTPIRYLQTYEDFGVGRRDPVAQHCKRSAVPIVWDQGTYLEKGAIDLWEHQAHFGYRHGIAMALHMPEGRHFMLGVDRDRPLPIGSAELTRMVADLQLFAVHAQDTALRVLVSEPLRPDCPALTPRELDVLRWTMDGQTSAQVASTLGIGERTALWHLQNAMLKLGCNSKHQAVLKALRLGLIH